MSDVVCVCRVARTSRGQLMIDGRRSPSAKTILCLQTGEADRAFLADLLRLHDVVFASTANEARRELYRVPFDAYVLDYWLPDWTGPQFCRELRGIDAHVPVVFYSAAGNDAQRTRAINAGASAYLVKPVDPSRLLAELHVLLEVRDLESIRARVEENQAVQHELERRASDVIKRTQAARHSAVIALERSAKAKAAVAFAKSGGTRSNFERWWPGMFETVWANVLVKEQSE
jgi:DNA-binding response OmpR family regulator